MASMAKTQPGCGLEILVRRWWFVHASCVKQQPPKVNIPHRTAPAKAGEPQMLDIIRSKHLIGPGPITLRFLVLHAAQTSCEACNRQRTETMHLDWDNRTGPDIRRCSLTAACLIESQLASLDYPSCSLPAIATACVVSWFAYSISYTVANLPRQTVHSIDLGKFVSPQLQACC